MATIHQARCSRPALCAIALLAGLPAAGATKGDAQSVTILGAANSQLADGASALRAGHVAEGLRLTLAGLNEPAELRDIAAGHANACAGYALLKQWDEALDQCNQAIGLDNTNWRAYNNRAAVYSARGLFDLAIHDIETGLGLAPNSETLLESMRVTQRNKRIILDRSHHSVPS